MNDDCLGQALAPSIYPSAAEAPGAKKAFPFSKTNEVEVIKLRRRVGHTSRHTDRDIETRTGLLKSGGYTLKVLKLWFKEVEISSIIELKLFDNHNK